MKRRRKLKLKKTLRRWGSFWVRSLLRKRSLKRRTVTSRRKGGIKLDP